MSRYAWRRAVDGSGNALVVAAARCYASSKFYMYLALNNIEHICCALMHFSTTQCTFALSCVWKPLCGGKVIGSARQ